MARQLIDRVPGDQRDRHNFLLGLKYDLGIEADRGTVAVGGRTTHVVAKPIGVDFDRISTMADDAAVAAEGRRLRRELSLDDPRIEIVGIGVDRLDYTKGIPERLDAIDALLTARPDLRSKLAFVQIGVPTRSRLESYAALEAEVDARVAAINGRHGTGSGPGPLRYWRGGLEMRPLVALYRLATFCIVSSLHDGMNLIAKEFVAARTDGDGVLLLGEMTGAAQELTEALIVNPYDLDGFVRLIERAIGMSRDERRRRMRALRRVVAGHTVFAWASEILGALDQLSVQPPPVYRLPVRHDGFVPARHAGFGRLATDAVG